MAKKIRERKPKVTIKVTTGRAKGILVRVDDEPVANIVDLKAKEGRAFVTTNPAKDTKQEILKSGRLHTTETSAVNRFRRITRKYPQITPRVKKLLR